MNRFIYPVSSSFNNMIALCKHFDKLSDFDILLTGNWGISAIISWDDETVTYPAVAKMVYEVINGPVTG